MNNNEMFRNEIACQLMEIQRCKREAIIDFLYSTGMRVSECASVELTDIDWSNRSVIIRHGKGNKERVVYFDAECEVSLHEYLTTRQDMNNGLFVSTRKPP